MIASRLRPPQALLALVRREELLSRLTMVAAPLLVVTAPGGYGKTVALSQWAANDGIPFTWLQADAADNDPVLFLHYLTAALGRTIDLDPQIVAWLDLAPPPMETRILPALAAAVGSAEPFVLVIDDVHVISSDLCWRIVGVLAEELPPGSHICVSGREDPPLPLARMRAAGRVLELGPADLALSIDETRDLLALHGIAIDDVTVCRLTEATEGWAAGVSLAALAWKEVSADEVLDGVRGDRRDIARYLASEVLDRQSPEVAAFLLRTSILERLSPALCRAVTGEDSAGDLLRAVAHGNLFVSALDGVGEWFRYHHLFAEFLQSELVRRRGEDEAAALHRRAAAWFEDHDALEEAVRHWLAGGDPRAAGDIVCRAHMGLSRCARYETVRRWLEMFTDEQILGDAALTLAAGWIGAMTGDPHRGRAWVQAAFHVDAGDALWPHTIVPLRVMQTGLIASLAPGGVTQMREHAELTVALSDGAHPAERAFAVTMLGIAQWLCGDPQAALPLLRQGGELGSVANVLAQVTAAGYQGLILADADRWDEARACVAGAIRHFEDAGLGWGVPTYPALLARARLEAHDHDLDLTESVATIAQLVDGGFPTFQALICEVLTGEILAETGDLEGARRWMRAGFARLSTWPDAGILRDRLQRLREHLEEREQIEPLTPAERRVLEFLPTELSQPEIAARLFVSPETVRTHVRDVYRKLDAHTRSQAVARAREVGLLGTD